MNQFATGDFGHGILSKNGIPETVNVRAWWCCTLHGLRAFSDLQNSAFRVSGNEAFFDFPSIAESIQTSFQRKPHRVSAAMAG